MRGVGGSPPTPLTIKNQVVKGKCLCKILYKKLANLCLGAHTMYMKYVIAHWTGKSFLGKSGWTSKAFARQFATFAEASDFCREHNLDEEGCYVELK